MELLTPNEAAKLLKVNRYTLDRWSRKGLITKLTIGRDGIRTVRFIKEDILSLFKKVNNETTK